MTLPASAEEKTFIFAASSLTNVVNEILLSAPDKSPTATSFAGTATLVRQIEAGAPADIFISANELWADHLEDRGHLETGTRRALAANLLVLVGPKASSLPELAPYHLLQHPKVRRIAIGETASVPAGIYGRQVLDNLGLWESLKPKLLPADSVRNVVAWVTKGEANLGFVYQSDAQASGKLRVHAIFRPGKATGLTPVYYTAAIIKGKSSNSTQMIFSHLFSPAAQTIFAAHGFQKVP